MLAIRDREILFEGDTLSFWLYSEDKIAALALPELRLHDTNRGFSTGIGIGEFCGDVPAKKWTRVLIPLNRIKAESVTSFEVHRLSSMIFAQGAADSTPHTLFIDEVRIENASASPADTKSAPPAPGNLQARAQEPGPASARSKTVQIKWPVLAHCQVRRRLPATGGRAGASSDYFLSIDYKHRATYSVVPWGPVCCHLSAPKVSGAASRSRVKIVTEGEIVPGWQGDDDCFARRIGQAEGLTNGLPR